MEMKYEITNALGLVRQEDIILYRELLEDFSKRTCVLFVGSGPSSSIFKSWDDLIDALGERANLKQLPKESKFRFADRCRNKLGLEKYYDFLKRRFDDTRLRNQHEAIHSHMVNTAFNAFVTTNYDLCLERAAGMDIRVSSSRMIKSEIITSNQPMSELAKPLIESVQCWPDCISPSSLKDPGRTLYHIHGSIAKGQTEIKLVLTESDYRQAYRSSDDITAFLIDLLAISDSMVVFCGYGFKDHELFNRVINNAKQALIKVQRRIPDASRVYFRRHFVFIGVNAKSSRRVKDYCIKAEVTDTLAKWSSISDSFRPQIEFIPILYANPSPKDPKKQYSYLTRIFEDMRKRMPFLGTRLFPMEGWRR